MPSFEERKTDRFRVSVLLPIGRDAELVGAILARHRITMASCHAFPDILNHIRDECSCFIIGEEVLSRNRLQRLAATLADQPVWSDLPGIVLTTKGSAKDTLAPLNGLREISIIERPVRRSVLVNLVQSALVARKRQYQVRRLMEELTEKNRRLRAQADLIQKYALELTRAENRERRRIGQLLHDELQQMLVAAKLQTEMLFDIIPPDRSPSVQSVYDILAQAIQSSRNLSHDLNPLFVTGPRFGKSLMTMGTRMAQHYGYAIETAIELADDEEMDEDIRLFVYRSVRELLLNCAKHAGGGSVFLGVSRHADALMVVVEDHGAGVAPETLKTGGGEKGGNGLLGIQERATVLGGALTIRSSPGAGCRIELRVPLSPHPEST